MASLKGYSIDSDELMVLPTRSWSALAATLRSPLVSIHQGCEASANRSINISIVPIV
jgi:hypothetical protein